MERSWLAIGILAGALTLACGDSGNGDAGDGDASGSASTGATEGTASSGTATTRGETGSATTPTGSGSGESGGLMCEDRGDCELFSDCCRCDAVHVDDSLDMCDAECERTTCQLWGVTEIACREGRCILAPVECDPATAVCGAPPPDCPEGTLPSIADGCWTGGCVPIELCKEG